MFLAFIRDNCKRTHFRGNLVRLEIRIIRTKAIYIFQKMRLQIAKLIRSLENVTLFSRKKGISRILRDAFEKTMLRQIYASVMLLN